MSKMLYPTYNKRKHAPPKPCRLCGKPIRRYRKHLTFKHPDWYPAYEGPDYFVFPSAPDFVFPSA
jgi:hypothetical protein